MLLKLFLAPVAQGSEGGWRGDGRAGSSSQHRCAAVQGSRPPATSVHATALRVALRIALLCRYPSPQTRMSTSPPFCPTSRASPRAASCCCSRGGGCCWRWPRRWDCLLAPLQRWLPALSCLCPVLLASACGSAAPLSLARRLPDTRASLHRLPLQLRSGSELRRRGCSGAIKNCCFSCEQDGTAEDIAGEAEVRNCVPRRGSMPVFTPAARRLQQHTSLMCLLLGMCCHSLPPMPVPQQALTAVLDVLCGITAAKEADDAVREALSEAILCLTRVDAARKALWKIKAPELLGKGCGGGGWGGGAGRVGRCSCEAGTQLVPSLAGPLLLAC